MCVKREGHIKMKIRKDYESSRASPEGFLLVIVSLGIKVKRKPDKQQCHIPHRQRPTQSITLFLKLPLPLPGVLNKTLRALKKRLQLKNYIRFNLNNKGRLKLL